ncbi:MAG: hypothetical protein AAFX78_13315 [Cyanobacteria bacterium J06638_20]
MTLFDPTRHYPLLELDWNPDAAQQAIGAIAHETITQLNEQPPCSLAKFPTIDVF